MLQVFRNWWRFKTEKQQDRWCALGVLAVAVLLGLMAIFGVSCVPVPAPSIPGVKTWPVACLVADAVDLTPIADAACQLDGQTSVTNADGYAGFSVIPDGEQVLTVTAPAYGDYAGRYGIHAATNLSITLRRLPPAHVDPSQFTDAQIRAVKTDLAGVYLDEIKPQCPEDPTTHIRCVDDHGGQARGVQAGILFTPNYRLYSTAQRQIIRDVFTGQRPDARGFVHHYTHYPISLFCRDLPDYHGIYPDCAHHAQVGLNDALHELLDAGLIPMGFVMHDDEPDDLATPLSVAGIVDPSLVPLVTPYWEHYAVDCAMVKVRALFPTARLYYHNPTNTDAGYPDACYAQTDAQYGALGGSRGWWQHFRETYHGRGAWIQNPEGSVADVIAGLTDFAARFGGGFNGWPTNLDAVWFEDSNSVYDNFWNGGDEGALLKRSDQVMAAQPFCQGSTCGSLAGYGSGGTR